MKEIEFDVTAFEKKESSTEKKDKPVSKVPTVRTFRNDVQDLMKEKTMSRSGVAMAEAARREARGEKRFPVEEDESHLGRLIFILFLVLAFGLGVGAYALIGMHFSLTGVSATSTAKHSATVSDISISLTNSPREQVLADISIAFSKTSLPTGGSRSLVFLISERGDERKATFTEFLKATAQGSTPSTLTSSLANDFTYRVFSNSTLSGVVMAQTRSYPDTFATMLDFESGMARAIIPVLDPWYDRKLIPRLDGRRFKDLRIGNYDARVLYDLDGAALLAYAFVNKKTLIIAGAADTLTEVLTSTELSK